LARVQEDLILTQEELTSTKKDLAFHESALQTMLTKDKEREAEDAEMDDSDNEANAGVSRVRREIESLKEKLRQSEQESHKLAYRLEDRIKESKRVESKSNRLKSKNNRLEEKVKQSQDKINRNKSSYDKVSSQLDIAQNSENAKGNQIINLTEKFRALQAQVAKHDKSVLEYQTEESDYQAEIMDLEERLGESLLTSVRLRSNEKRCNYNTMS